MIWFATLFQAFRASKNAQIIAAIALVIVVGLGLYIWIITNRQSDLQDAADQARNQVSYEATKETLNRTVEAKDAAEKVRTDPVARRDGCLRHSRTPANCD